MFLYFSLPLRVFINSRRIGELWKFRSLVSLEGFSIPFSKCHLDIFLHCYQVYGSYHSNYAHHKVFEFDFKCMLTTQFFDFY